MPGKTRAQRRRPPARPSGAHPTPRSASHGSIPRLCRVVMSLCAGTSRTRLLMERPLSRRMRLRMTGRIKIGLWLPFTAQQDCDGSSFIWRAQVPRRGRFLTVTDSYDDGRAAIDRRLLSAIRMFPSDDQNIVRSAAGRAAAEGILAPIGLLPSPARIWRAESDNEITVELALAPERPALHVTIDNDGAVQSVNLQRWGNAGEKAFGYLPFGGDVLAEKRFGDFVLPSRLRVGWWHGTERFSPFFEAEIISAVPKDRGRPDRPENQDQSGRELIRPGQPHLAAIRSRVTFALPARAVRLCRGSAGAGIVIAIPPTEARWSCELLFTTVRAQRPGRMCRSRKSSRIRTRSCGWMRRRSAVRTCTFSRATSRS